MEDVLKDSGLRSFTLIDKNGNETYFADLKVYIGYTSSDNYIEPPANILSPSVNNITEKIMGMDGEYYFGKDYQSLKFKIPCVALNLTEDEKFEVQKALTFKKPRKLIFDKEPHKYIWVIVDEQTDLKGVDYGTHYNVLFEITMLAIDPFKYSYYTSTDDFDSYDLHSIYANTNLNSFNVPPCIIEDITETKTFKLYNHGNAEAKMYITMVGTGEDIKISNLTNNTYLQISEIDNQTIIIDGNLGKVTINNILQNNLMTGDFLILENGYNNFQIEGTNLNISQVSFSYRHTYI